MTVRPAHISDAQAICDLVNSYAERGLMLHRSLESVYEDLREFQVAENAEGHLVGCAAVDVFWDDLAEVKSLAGVEDVQSGGDGTARVRACIDEGRQLGLSRLFALTYRPGFFERLDFVQADVMNLPRKVWNECYRCPKFPGCEEIAMTLELEAAPSDVPQ